MISIPLFILAGIGAGLWWRDRRRPVAQWALVAWCVVAVGGMGLLLWFVLISCRYFAAWTSFGTIPAVIDDWRILVDGLGWMKRCVSEKRVW